MGHIGCWKCIVWEVPLDMSVERKENPQGKYMSEQTICRWCRSLQRTRGNALGTTRSRRRVGNTLETLPPQCVCCLLLGLDCTSVINGKNLALKASVAHSLLLPAPKWARAKKRRSTTHQPRKLLYQKTGLGSDTPKGMPEHRYQDTCILGPRHRYSDILAF